MFEAYNSHGVRFSSLQDSAFAPDCLDLDSALPNEILAFKKSRLEIMLVAQNLRQYNKIIQDSKQSK